MAAPITGPVSASCSRAMAYGRASEPPTDALESSLRFGQRNACQRDPIDMATPRTTEPVRNQAQIHFEMPEDALSPEHPARVLWEALGKLDLSAFLANARSF